MPPRYASFTPKDRATKGELSVTSTVCVVLGREDEIAETVEPIIFLK